MEDNFEDIIKANYQLPEGFDPWAWHMTNAMHYLRDHNEEPLGVANAQAHAFMAMSWAARKQIDVLEQGGLKGMSEDIEEESLELSDEEAAKTSQDGWHQFSWHVMKADHLLNEHDDGSNPVLTAIAHALMACAWELRALEWKGVDDDDGEWMNKPGGFA